MPKAHPHRLVLAKRRADLGGAPSVVLSEERTKPTKFIIAPGVLKLTAYSSNVGEAEEQLDVEYTGDEMTIGFQTMR